MFCFMLQRCVRVYYNFLEIVISYPHSDLSVGGERDGGDRQYTPYCQIVRFSTVELAFEFGRSLEKLPPMKVRTFIVSREVGVVLT